MKACIGWVMYICCCIVAGGIIGTGIQVVRDKECRDILFEDILGMTDTHELAVVPAKAADPAAEPAPQPAAQPAVPAPAAANFEITAGSMIQLKGARLKYDDTDSEQGVFLIGTKTSEAVRMGKAVLNKPAMVIVQVPADLSAGEYELEVRTKVDGKHIYKTVKKGRFQRTIYVIA